MRRGIAGFHQDADAHWVAVLECGHFQHVRHDPPWMMRPWVVSAEGRAAMLGSPLDCKKCDADEPPDDVGFAVALSPQPR